ncbi:MAG: glutamine synthetase family protein [Desulfobacterales bacterium]|jgi:glutamine synthetase
MTKEQIIKKAKEHEVDLIRFVYIDNDGVIRGYSTTSEELEGDLDLGHPFAVAMPFFSVLDDLPPGTRFGCVGEIIGLPDTQTFRILPYAPHAAMLICDFVEKADHSATGLCARSLLKKFLSSMEFEVRAAFENEFYLLKRDASGSLQPFDQSLCFATGGMNQQHAVVLDIIRALKAQGLRVEKYYPEYGSGQVEIVYRYADALRTADNQIFFRETCRGVAQQHELTASFMPKPFQHLAGSGAHLHLSLWKEDQNLFYDGSAEKGLSDTGRYFIGGILKHIKALCCFTASTVNSYKRLVPHSWASAYTCWGFDNREAAVRAITGMKGREAPSFNIEFKPVDPACNPYLAILTVLAAGMDGVRNKIEPGEAVDMDPHDLTPGEKQARGIGRLPETLGQAIEALKNDAFFPEILGRVFFEEYLALKRFAWTEYIRHISAWEMETYVEAF